DAQISQLRQNITPRTRRQIGRTRLVPRHQLRARIAGSAQRRAQARDLARDFMRHRRRTAKLGRQFEHRNAMLANLVCSLIKHRRVTTTLAKAKAARSVAEKMVTLGKSGTIHHRRLAAARLPQEAAAKLLFKDIAPD